MLFRFCAILLFAALTGAAPARALEIEKRFQPANPPQALPLFQFEDAKGKQMSLRDFKGRYVLLNVWTTSCVPCVAEMPSLDGLIARIGVKNFDVIALAEDHDGAATVPAFYQRHHIGHLPVFIDRSGMAPFILNLRGMPTTILIDPQGREIGRVEAAADWAAPETIAFLRAKMGR